MNAAVLEGISLDFPAKVADAINILRHEKIGRWDCNTWVWADDPNWDTEALKLANGVVDRQKQDALYVGLRKDGSLASTPAGMNTQKAKEEYERGRRFGQLIDSLARPEHPVGTDYERVEGAFKALFVETGK